MSTFRSPLAALPPRVRAAALFTFIVAFAYVHAGVWGVVTLAGINLLVLGHELGHFAVGRLLGLGVSDVSVGFGSIVAERRFRGRPWRLRSVPLGGFVALSAADGLPGAGAEDVPAYKRLIVAAAGPLGSFATAAVLLAVVFGAFGAPVNGDTVTAVPAGSVLQRGDQLVAVNGSDETRWSSDLVGGATVLRDGVPVAVTVTPETFEQVSFEVEKVRLAPHKAALGGAIATVALTKLTWDGLASVASGESTSRPVSPLGIVAAGAEGADAMGFTGVVILLAALSVWLGIFNLFPVPPLDGGAAVIAAVETVVQRRRPGWRMPSRLVLTVTLTAVVLLVAVTLWGFAGDLGLLG